MGRKPHKFTKYFRILPKLANVRNKACICLACYDANPDGPYKELTNTPKLCKDYLKKCPYFLSQYSSEELAIIFLDTNNIEPDDDYSEIEISEPSTKRACIEKSKYKYFLRYNYFTFINSSCIYY